MERRHLIRAIIIISAVWMAFTVGASVWQRRTAKQSPPLLHYPGTEARPEQTSRNQGLRRYWFTLEENYPSLSVYKFYQQALTARGWKLLGNKEPAWQRVRVEGDFANDVFGALWASPDRIYQLQLQMESKARLIRAGDKVVSETREPGIRVYVTQQRSVGPWLLEPKAKSPSAPIDLKGEGQ